MDAPQGTGKVKATGLNLRDDADPNATVLVALPQGTPVQLMSPNADDTWVMVDAVVGGEDRIGWVPIESLTLDGVTDPPPNSPPGPGATNPHFPGVLFTALVPGGFFSSEPENLKILRAIRTNNPGAINDIGWQHARPGYVGKSISDSVGNVTAIYCAPEYGVASWYTLLADHYGYKKLGGVFTLSQLAHNYAGGGASLINGYISAWTRLADKPLTAQSSFHLDNDDEMLNLARAMFRNEASKNLKIGNDQILFGIRNERANTLPPPPKPPAGGARPTT